MYLLCIGIVLWVSWPAYIDWQDSKAMDRISSVHNLAEVPVHTGGHVTPACDEWLPTISYKQLDGALSELSGMESSEEYAGRLYLANDSLNAAELFLASGHGEIDSRLDLSVDPVDTEDLAIGPCPGSTNCLFIADIGDNFRLRPVKTIFIKSEEELGNRGSLFDELDFRYEWDLKLDAETLMVHPRSGNIYIISKGEDSLIFRLDANSATVGDTTQTAKFVAALDHDWITAGDFHPSGEMFVLGGDHIYEYFIDLDTISSPVSFEYSRHFRQIPAREAVARESITYSADAKDVLYGSERPFLHSVAESQIGRIGCKTQSAGDVLSNIVPITIDAGSGILRGAMQFIETEIGRIAVSTDIGREKLEDFDPDLASATYEFLIVEKGTYYVFGLVNSPKRWNNSFYYRFDDGPVDVWETYPTEGWVWSRFNKQNGSEDVSFNFKPGRHILEIGQREPATALTQLVISANPNRPGE